MPFAVYLRAALAAATTNYPALTLQARFFSRAIAVGRVIWPPLVDSIAQRGSRIFLTVAPGGLSSDNRRRGVSVDAPFTLFDRRSLNMKRVFASMFALTIVGLALGIGIGQEYGQNESESSRRQSSDRSRTSGESERSRQFGDQSRNRQDSFQSSERSQSQRRGQDSFSQPVRQTSAQSAETAREFIRQYDQNDDGHLSKRELPSHLTESFDQLDRDSDGYLSRSELALHGRQMSRQTPVGVAYIWIVEANSGPTKLKDLQQAYEMLRQLDQDDDGYITRTELRERQQQSTNYWINHCFDCLDENADDQITRTEASGSTLEEQFDQVDRNSDERITRSELRTASREQGSDSSEIGEASRRRYQDDDSESR